MTNQEAFDLIGIIGRLLGEWLPGETSQPFRNALGLGMMALENKPEAEEYRTPMTEWIPVTERLPETGEDMLVTTIEKSSNGSLGALNIRIANFRDGRWIINGHTYIDNERFIEEVTAWMPLPEPYWELA